MAITFITADSIGAGNRVTIAAGNQAFVANGVTVGSTDNNGIICLDNVASVQIAGSVIGSSAGVRFGDDATDGNYRVEITSTGMASGGVSAGVRIIGSNSQVVNMGTVSGPYGVIMGSFGATVSTLYNGGTISGSQYAVLRVTGATDTLQIINDGTIIGGNANGPFSAVYDNGNVSVEILVNRGLIVGDVTLGFGNDVYDGRGGTVQGVISAGGDTDTFRVGAGFETIDGGAGNDLLDFRSTSGIQVALDAAFANTGTAAGDEYTNIENIYGSNTGADLLRGNALNNGFYGFGGNDTLQGGTGGDQLAGGNGADAINGGAGNDTFLFTGLSEAGDVIVDFSNVAGNDDRFVIRAAGFGAGLVAGALNPNLFFSSATNIAGGAEDRFVFNTTTTTLWFDSNGSAAGGLTMIADLQAGATMTAADIVLI